MSSDWWPDFQAQSANNYQEAVYRKTHTTVSTSTATRVPETAQLLRAFAAKYIFSQAHTQLRPAADRELHDGAELSVDTLTGGTSKHLLALDAQTTDHQAQAANAEASPSSPDVSLSVGGASESQPVHDEAPIEDAADQQAMQHGSGALESDTSVSTDSGRELHRQLGQRFNASQINTGSINFQESSGQDSPDPSAVQAEITPGT